MATVLKRPMFRIGGSADGTGITSGLRRYGFENGTPIVSDQEILEAKKKVFEPSDPTYGF